jgi:hypothetical protein
LLRLSSSLGPNPEVEQSLQVVLFCGCSLGAVELEVGNSNLVDSSCFVKNCLSVEDAHDYAALVVVGSFDKLRSWLLLASLLRCLPPASLDLFELSQLESDAGSRIGVAEDALLADKPVLVRQIFFDELNWFRLLWLLNAESAFFR